MDKTEQELIEFIETKVGVKVNRDSLIFEDLGIDGLDAETFFDEFSHRFDVDMSGFNPSEFFSSEYELSNIFLTIYRALFRRKSLEKKAFKVSHLIKVIEQKRWTNPSELY